MKTRKLLAFISAMSIMASSMAISVSASNLGDYAHPSEEDSEINDAFYSIGAMGFYMNQTWSWNQGDWVGISDDGKIEINYKISEVLADTTISNKGTLGDMGVMILNMPTEGYPYDITISDAKFVSTDGVETKLTSIEAITQATEDPEGGFRIHIRPTDEVNEETGEVLRASIPEVAGWEQEGAFNGGTLSMTIDFNLEEVGTDSSSTLDDTSSATDDSSKSDSSSTADSDSSSKADTSSSQATSSSKDSASTTTTTGNNKTTTSTTSTTSPVDNSNAETGAESYALLCMTLAGAVVVLSKKKK